MLFFAGAGHDAGVLPARSGAGAAARRRGGRAAARPEPTQNQKSEFERWYASQPRVPLVVPAEGAKVLIVKFNDYQCPACGQSYHAVQADPREVRSRAPRRGRAGHEGLPAQLATATTTIGQTIHPAACDAAVAVRLARQHKREAMEEWLYTHQPAMTPPSVRQAARDVGQVTDFDAKYAVDARAVKSDVALGKQLGVTLDADLLHQRREDRGRLRAAVLRPGDRLSSCSARQPNDRQSAGGATPV